MTHGIALITINAIVFVLGSLGNLLVCLAMLQILTYAEPPKSPMNFLIYSAKIWDFKDAYVDIFWKMLRL